MDLAGNPWHNESGNHTSLQTEYLLSNGKHLQRKEYFIMQAMMTWNLKKSVIYITL
jgi:hypothetical protein